MPVIGQISVGDGATFTPSVDSAGVLSWTNNKNLTNPATVDLAQAVLDKGLLAPIASPSFTGTPTAPTQAKTDDSTKLATTAYVKAVVADYLELTGGSITGNVDITGDLSVTGAITGDLTGNVTGNVTGDLTGNVTGNVAGDLTGNVTGNVTGAATSATNDGNGNNIANTYLPAVVGAVVAFAGSTSPAGWLLCDGSAVSRTTYAALFAVIGTTYGSGDGSATFNLPNLTDKFIQGNATSGTVKSAGLPNISGSFWKSGTGLGLFDGVSGAFSGTNFNTHPLAGESSTYSLIANVSIDASRSSSIYGNSTTVQPPALTMRYIIKY